MIAQSEYVREEHVIMALRSSLGNKGLAAKELGLTRGELNDYIIRHPDVREELSHIKESILDNAEDLLIQKMQTDNTLLMFYLRHQGKMRGYSSDMTLSGPGGGPINVNVNARTLIAAMRNGLDNDSEEEHEDGNLLE